MQNNSPITPPSVSSSISDAGLCELITELAAVDISSPFAKENELTYSDNNGGRIEL